MSERIAQIVVREGQTVAAGDTVLVLEPERTGARLDAARADAMRLRAALDEARAGPRGETIAAARAQLRGAEGVALTARRDFDRVRRMVEREMLPPSDLDFARAALASADAQELAARESLTLLENGTRSEQIVQAEAALAAAEAEVQSLQVDLARTRITAPRAGFVESLPYRLGDQVPVGTPLAILLVGDRPYARVYIPQPLRASVQVGTTATVRLHGTDIHFNGRVRAIRSEPSFTPYYALSGEDASRLSWLAEIELDTAADALPIGHPVRAEFQATKP
ncbi:HlyD family secretion protein [Arenimonas daejeonensis]|uniref:HlyD family secretion protein n=1 Tax=Arenimonas daejeonensis TaxID=370777 RepID=UPI001D151F96|nr:HlyD family efflux transporter periplasmic adaptor subunit [Arenimonas daejeonensis]